jgi:O-antigen/teichoic acid export membrane protein
LGLAARLRGSRFLRDTAVLQVAAAVGSVASLASAFALAFLLGPRSQGEYYLGVATWSFLWVTVNLGLYNVATSQIAAAAARGNSLKVGAWMAWMVKASLATGLCASLVAWFGLPHFARWAYDSPTVGRVTLVLAFTPLAELPRVVLNSALQGARRMGALARVENGQELSRVFFVIAGAIATGDAVGPAIGMVLSSAVGSLLSIDAYRREARLSEACLPTLGQVRERLRQVPVRHGLRLGLRVGLVRNIDAYGVQILPSVVLGIFGDTAWITYTRLAQRFVDVARTMMSGINRTALSHFSGLAGKQDLDSLEGAYWRASLGSGVMISVGLLASLPFAPWVISHFPLAYREPVWLCYRILVPGVMVASFSVANDTFYMVTNTLKVAVVLQVIGLAVGVSMMSLFAWTWPTVGVAIGLSANFLWALTHMSYAGWWFRRRRRVL